MMLQPVTLVCGFGRCGSSLVMQMLRAGGMLVTGEWPGFEDDRSGLTTFDSRWIAAQGGSAVKFLDPQVQVQDRLLARGSYRSIWLDRDLEQQALSVAKFHRTLLGIETSRRARRAIIASYQRDRPRALAILRAHGPVIETRFEDLLLSPATATRTLADFCSISHAKLPLMYLAILPRSPSAQRDLALEAHLIEAGPP